MLKQKFIQETGRSRYVGYPPRRCGFVGIGQHRMTRSWTSGVHCAVVRSLLVNDLSCLFALSRVEDHN